MNCWKTKPNARSRSSASSWSPQRVAGRGPRRRPGRRSGGRARRAAGAASSCPSRSGPRARRTRRRRSGGRRPRRARTVTPPLAEGLRGVPDVVERRPSTPPYLSASAGPQPRGAERARGAGEQAAGEREPEAERAAPSTAIGAVERDLVAHGPGGQLPEPEDVRAAAAGRRARRQRRAEGADRGRGADAERRRRAGRRATPCANDSPTTCRTTSALRPAERLQRPDLADALADRREREQHGEQERGERGEHGERDPEPVREVRGVDERAADLSRRPASRSRPARSGTSPRSPSGRSRPSCCPSRARARRSTTPCLARELLELASGTYTSAVWPPSGGLTSPTTVNVVPFRSSFEPTFSFCRRRVGRGEERLGSSPSRRGSGRSRRATGVTSADVGPGRIDAADRVGRALDVRLRRVDDLLDRLLGRRDRRARKLRTLAGRHFANAPRSKPPAGAAAAAGRRRGGRPAGPARFGVPSAGAVARALELLDARLHLGPLGLCRLDADLPGHVSRWPPVRIFATIFGTVPSWCTPLSTSPLDTAATPASEAICFAWSLRERQLRAGQEEVVHEVRRPALPSLERSVIADGSPEHLAAAAEAAAAGAAAAGVSCCGESVTVRSVPMLESGSSASACARSSPRESAEIVITSATPTARPEQREDRAALAPRAARFAGSER